MKRIFLSIILTVAMLLEACPVIAAESSKWGVEGIFGENFQSSGMSAKVPTAGVDLKRAVRDGQTAWVMEGWEANYHSLYMDLNTGNIRSKGSSNVLIEIDYYDEEANGWFYIKYDSRDERECYTKPHYTKGTKKWKTATFILEAPTFTNAISGGDFAISTLMDKDYSMHTVIISSVRVKQLDEIKPAEINLITNRTGNIYFSDEEWIIGVETVNKVDKDFDADLKIYIKDVWGNVVYEQSEILSLKRSSKETRGIKLNYDKFGVYTIHLEAQNQENKYRFSTYRDISYIKKSEFMNDNFGVNNKFGYMSQMGRDPDLIFSLVKDMGIGWTRDEVFWDEFETGDGKYALADRHKEYMESAQKFGIEQLIIFGYGHPTHTGSRNTHPNTESGIEAFGKFVYELTKQTEKYGISHFEILNEYNHWNARRDLELYDDICKAVAENARKANPDVTLVGFTASAYNLVDFITAVFDEGGAEYMDAISYHNYAAGSPLSQNVDNDTINARKLLESRYPKYKDMPLWKTEHGWSNGRKGASWTNVSHVEKTASFIPQEFAMQMAAGLDKIFQYQFMNWDVPNNVDIAQLEMAWGMLNTYKGIKTPYSAKPVVASTAAMNSFLGTPEFISKQHSEDVNIYNFKRTQDNTKVAMLWTEKSERCITLNIPGAEVELYDLYGNKLNIAKNGDSYTFNISDKQVYIVGDYETINVNKQTVFISSEEIVTVPGETFSFSLYRLTNDRLNIEVTKDDASDIEILSVPDFDKKIATVKIKANGKEGCSENLKVRVTDAAGNNIFDRLLTITYSEPLNISGRTKLHKPEDINRWKMVFDIESHYHSDNLRAKLKINEPKDFARFDVDLGEIKPGKNQVSFYLPEISGFAAYTFDATLELSNGYKKDITMPIDFTLAFYADTPPVIDGAIEANEYHTEGELIIDRKENFYSLMPEAAWKGKEDQSAKTYLNWDENYLYLASIVEDDIHSCAFERDAIWQGDCMQLGLNYGRENGAPSSSFTELGFALNPESGIQKYKYAAESGTPDSFSEATEVIIKREGTKTYYEMKLAWKDFLPEGKTMSEGKEMAFAFLVNENDGYGRRGWVEYGSGLGDGKKVEKFARITLVK